MLFPWVDVVLICENSVYPPTSKLIPTKTTPFKSKIFPTNALGFTFRREVEYMSLPLPSSLNNRSPIVLQLCRWYGQVSDNPQHSSFILSPQSIGEFSLIDFNLLYHRLSGQDRRISHPIGINLSLNPGFRRGEGGW